MLNLLEGIRISFSSLQANKFRALLSATGIVMGVASVMTISAIGQSGQLLIIKELETFGLKSVWVYRDKGDQPTKTERGGDSIVNEDLEAILRHCSKVHRVSPLYADFFEIRTFWASYQGKYAKAGVSGVNTEYQYICKEEVIQGRFLVPADIERRRKVCVIGVKIYKNLFGEGSDCLGEYIDFGLGKFEVVGVLKEKSRDLLTSIRSAVGQDVNERIIIPHTVYQSKYNLKNIWVIQAEATSTEEADIAAQQIKGLLRARHQNKYEYRSETMKQYIQTSERIVGIAWWVAFVAAMIALSIGGIGIMNIMTSAVMERIREIGIRKSLGARDKDILFQFLIESVMISLVGGIIGILLGLGVTLGIAYFSNKPIQFSINFVILGLVVSILTGILSGLYPAYRAARLDPVEALASI